MTLSGPPSVEKPKETYMKPAGMGLACDRTLRQVLRLHGENRIDPTISGRCYENDHVSRLSWMCAVRGCAVHRVLCDADPISHGASSPCPSHGRRGAALNGRAGSAGRCPECDGPGTNQLPVQYDGVCVSDRIGIRKRRATGPVSCVYES